MVRRTLRKIRARRKRAETLRQANRRIRWLSFFSFVQFLIRKQTLELSRPDPEVSVILVLYGKAPLSLRCLRSLQKQTVPFELIVINNGRDRRTRRLLTQIRGAKVVSKPHNVGFLRAANEGAQMAETDTLLFLNNDTELTPQCIEWGLRALREEPGVGAVGGKVIGFDNRLLEAGASVWQDGSTECLGRGQPREFNRFNYRRDTDYVSGCFLLTPTALFRKMEGFDEAFVPAYYEDADYCMRLWEKGYRVVFEPRAELYHFENASSRSPSAAKKLMIKNKEVFFAIHEDRLAPHPYPNLAPRSRRRLDSVHRPRKQLLYLDDRVPHLHQGSGFPRSNAIVRTLVELGWQVTIYPVSQFQPEPWGDAFEDLPPQVRIEWGKGQGALPYFLNFNRDTFDQIWVSRSHNLVVLKRALKIARVPWNLTPVLFDSEAFAAERNFLLDSDKLLMGRSALEAARAQEIDLVRGVDQVVVVNEKDRQTFEQAGVPSVRVVSHVVTPQPTQTSFHKRPHFLFVGALDDDSNPNVLALTYFIRRIWPLVRAVQPDASLQVVGSCRSSQVQKLRRVDGVKILGIQKDLVPHFEHARYLVAPHSIGAGLPLKVIHSAAFGVPSIVSPLLREQLGWTDGVITADPASPEAFAQACTEAFRDESRWHRLREAARIHLERDHTAQQMRDQVAAALIPSTKKRVPIVHRGLEGFGYGPERSPTQ